MERLFQVAFLCVRSWKAKFLFNENAILGSNSFWLSCQKAILSISYWYQFVDLPYHSQGRSNSRSLYMTNYFFQIMIGKKVRKKIFFCHFLLKNKGISYRAFLTPSFWLYENQNLSTIPVGKYLFQGNNKNTRKTFIGVILVSLLLTLKKYSPSGTLSIYIHWFCRCFYVRLKSS